MYGRMKQLYKAFIAFSIDPVSIIIHIIIIIPIIVTQNYGCNPSREEILSVDGICPICQEEMNDPIMLKACNVSIYLFVVVVVVVVSICTF